MMCGYSLPCGTNAALYFCLEFIWRTILFFGDSFLIIFLSHWFGGAEDAQSRRNQRTSAVWKLQTTLTRMAVIIQATMLVDVCISCLSLGLPLACYFLCCCTAFMTGTHCLSNGFSKLPFGSPQALLVITTSLTQCLLVLSFLSAGEVVHLPLKWPSGPSTLGCVTNQ